MFKKDLSSEDLYLGLTINQSLYYKNQILYILHLNGD